MRVQYNAMIMQAGNSLTQDCGCDMSMHESSLLKLSNVHLYDPLTGFSHGCWCIVVVR